MSFEEKVRIDHVNYKTPWHVRARYWLISLIAGSSTVILNAKISIVRKKEPRHMVDIKDIAGFYLKDTSIASDGFNVVKIRKGAR